MNEITSENFVEKVSEKVKHYDYEPLYFLRVQHYGHYEILVNDIPVFKYYRDGSYGSPIEMNYAILKTGKQKVTFRLFSEKGFDATDDFNIKVGVLDNKGGKRIEDEKTITQYITKSGELPIGKNYYEGSFTFDATVPYENKGWSEGQDLTKFNKDELETAVVAFYKKIGNIYSDIKRKEDIYIYIYNKDLEISQANFEDKKSIKKRQEVYLRPYENTSFKIQPLENYQLKLFGDGMVVALILNSMDIRLRNKTALWAKYNDKDGDLSASFPSLYLYLPQGKKLQDGLQIIR